MREETHRITRIVPPVWLMLTMLFMYLLNAFVPLAPVFSYVFMPFGQVLVFLGFSLVFLSVRCFKKARTPLKPFVPVKAVITTGPFRYSRNPVYLGMFMIVTGWAIYLTSFSPWLPAMGFVWMICRYWVPMEELQMEREMGDAYLAYKKQVRRWL
jgi:protein-S-isoprenylcysteine O-methyltransferase Ste14